jgi:hypothetical protein
MQHRLGIARQPATGRDMELWDSKSCQGRVTCKIPARILLGEETDATKVVEGTEKHSCGMALVSGGEKEPV